MSSPAVQVVIVGAGPVGLTLANLLGVQGIHTVVLDRDPSTVEESRAVTMDDEALRILSATGLIDTLTPDMRLNARATFYDQQGGLLYEISPTRLALGFPLINFFLQSRLEESLLEGTRRFEHVQVKFLHTVDRVTQTGDAVTVEGLDGEQRRFSLSAQYLVGCDGGRSTIRSQLGLKLIGSTYKERWLVLDVSGYSHEQTQVRFFCDPKRPTVSVPMPHGRHRWEFLLHGHETDAEMLDPAKIDELVRPHADPRSIQLLRKVVHPFHARRAEHFRKGRILLAGDAAHLMPPFAGQGMCSGLRDASNLSWKLEAILKGRATEALLDTYEAERSLHVKKMTTLSRAMGQVVMARSASGVIVRNILLRLLWSDPGIQRFLREMEFKPAPEISGGMIWSHLERGPWTGVMFPQPRVRTPSGEIVLLDQVLSPDFTLIGLGADPSFALPAGSRTRWKQIASRHLRLVPPSSRAPLRENEVMDVDGAFFSKPAERTSGLCLVRPDRFVAAHFQADQAPLVQGFLERVFPAL